MKQNKLQLVYGWQTLDSSFFKYRWSKTSHSWCTGGKHLTALSLYIDGAKQATVGVRVANTWLHFLYISMEQNKLQLVYGWQTLDCSLLCIEWSKTSYSWCTGDKHLTAVSLNIDGAKQATVGVRVTNTWLQFLYISMEQNKPQLVYGWQILGCRFFIYRWSKTSYSLCTGGKYLAAVSLYIDGAKQATVGVRVADTWLQFLAAHCWYLHQIQADVSEVCSQIDMMSVSCIKIICLCLTETKIPLICRYILVNCA
jgi:hypothetical protein